MLFCEHTASRERKLLRINLDETACRLYYEQGKGLVFQPAAGPSGKNARLVQDVSTKRRRGCFTHIAMICDDASIQPRLPQILVGNERIFPGSVVGKLVGRLAPNIFVWRRQTGWVTKALMREVLALLLTSLGELTATHQVILLLDTAPVHMCKRFLAQASRHGVIVQYVPAKLTWLLQPLDSHAFSRYKRCLRELFRSYLLESADGHCDTEAIIRLVAQTCLKVLQGVSWAYAFDGNGFGARQKKARANLLCHTEWTSPPELTARLPTYDEVKSIFPARGQIPLREMLSVFTNGHGCAKAHKPLARSLQNEPCPEPAGNIWAGRLRSSSRAELTADAAEQPATLPTAFASTVSASEPSAAPQPAQGPGVNEVASRRQYPIGRPLFIRRSRSWFE